MREERPFSYHEYQPLKCKQINQELGMHAASNWVAIHTCSSMHAENTNQPSVPLGLVLIEVVLQFPTTCSQLFFTKTEIPLVLYIPVMEDMKGG
jgi:hypothetical protein